MVKCIEVRYHAKCHRVKEGLTLEEMGQANKQCYHEFKNLIHRWSEESDLEDAEIVQCMVDAAKEYYDEDVIEFEIDFELEEEDEE
jgi:hypothetical protein